MGADQSKTLLQWTVDDVVVAISSLGEQYSSYEGIIRENSMNGAFLLRLPEAEIDNTLINLGVESRLHRRVLVKKILGLGQDGTFKALIVSMNCLPL